jgi:transcription initiation factor TFIIB
MTTVTKRTMWKSFDDLVFHNEIKIKLQNQYQCTRQELSDDLYNYRCNACCSILNIMEDGFPTCPSCGLMHRHILDYSPEWRFYKGNEKNISDPTRCGNPINPLLKESSFGCTILCNHNSSYEMRRIRKWSEWQSTPHREKTLYAEFQFISIMAQNAGIPKSLIDYAMMVHKELTDQIMFRGMNRDGIKAASLYISCRHNGFQRSPHEIATIFQLDKHSATHGCSKGVSIWNNIERGLHSIQKTNLDIMTPRHFVDRYCSRLDMNEELVLLVKFIADRVENSDIIAENTPQSSAAGIVFFVANMSNLAITKSDIRQLCDVSEVTINKCYNKFYAVRHELLPKCIMKKYNML